MVIKSILVIIVCLLAMQLAGCASSIAQNDILDISPKRKSFEEIVSAFEEKEYRCYEEDVTKYEYESFEKHGFKVEKYSCFKQTSSVFCVNSQIIDIYRDKESKAAIYLTGRTSPVCIWH